MKKWLLEHEPHLNLLLLVIAMIGIFCSFFNVAFMGLTIVSLIAWVVLLEVCIQEFIRSHQELGYDMDIGVGSEPAA